MKYSGTITGHASKGEVVCDRNGQTWRVTDHGASYHEDAEDLVYHVVTCAAPKGHGAYLRLMVAADAIYRHGSTDPTPSDAGSCASGDVSPLMRLHVFAELALVTRSDDMGGRRWVRIERAEAEALRADILSQTKLRVFDVRPSGDLAAAAGLCRAVRWLGEAPIVPYVPTPLATGPIEIVVSIDWPAIHAAAAAVDRARRAKEITIGHSGITDVFGGAYSPTHFEALGLMGLVKLVHASDAIAKHAWTVIHGAHSAATRNRETAIAAARTATATALALRDLRRELERAGVYTDSPATTICGVTETIQVTGLRWLAGEASEDAPVSVAAAEAFAKGGLGALRAALAEGRTVSAARVVSLASIGGAA